ACTNSRFSLPAGTFAGGYLYKCLQICPQGLVGVQKANTYIAYANFNLNFGQGSHSTCGFSLRQVRFRLGSDCCCKEAEVDSYSTFLLFVFSRGRGHFLDQKIIWASYAEENVNFLEPKFSQTA
ncbi:unnamed protein product, partial [Ectocarpus sp. 12 AP-2014]